MWVMDAAGERARRSLLRIIDANRNRAAEALRVAEDVCRFHHELAGVASDLKALRHDALRAADALPVEPLERLSARDAEGDPRRGSPPLPAPPGDASALGLRNIERAREALRALEEASRALFPGTATGFEELRYRLYSIEKVLAALAPRAGGLGRLEGVRLCLLATGSLASRPLEEVVEAAVRAGAGMVQLREKGRSDAELLRRALAVRELTARLGALFVVNDRPDIALLARADGVHLGQSDLPVAAARSILGAEALIGVSTHSEAEIDAAERAGAHYIGVGPAFPTRTKDAGPPLGGEGLRRLLARTALPAFAIGGIGPATALEAARAGATRVAVSSAVLGAPDPGRAVREILSGLAAGEEKGRKSGKQGGDGTGNEEAR